MFCFKRLDFGLTNVKQFLGGHPNNLLVFVLVFVHVPMSLCLCDIFLVLDQNTLRPLLQSILVFVCLMEQERGEGGAAPHIFKHHFHIFYFIEGGRNYSLCLSPSSTFQELLWSDDKPRIMKLPCWFLMLSINIRSLGAGPTVQYPIKLVAVEGPCVFGRPPILRSTSLEE